MSGGRDGQGGRGGRQQDSREGGGGRVEKGGGERWTERERGQTDIQRSSKHFTLLNENCLQIEIVGVGGGDRLPTPPPTSPPPPTPHPKIYVQKNTVSQNPRVAKRQRKRRDREGDKKTRRGRGGSVGGGERERRIKKNGGGEVVIEQRGSVSRPTKKEKLEAAESCREVTKPQDGDGDVQKSRPL